MSIHPSNWLQYADTLARDARGNETALRTAVSRAYYGAFHDCLNWYAKLPDVGSPPSANDGQGMHKAFFDKLENPGKGLSIEQADASIARGRALRALHLDRVVADYKLAKEVAYPMAATAVAKAKKIAQIGADLV